MTPPPPGPPDEELELVNVPGWSSNADAQTIAERLKIASRAVVFTHTKPDGDAIGASLAITRSLRSLDIDATHISIGPWSERFDFLNKTAPILHRDPDQQPSAEENDLVAAADTLVVCDTGSWSQLEAVRMHLEGAADKTVIIDHHGHGDESVATLRWIDTAAAAACEMATTLCARLLDLDSPAKLPNEIASALYLGIATDTGWFRFSNVTSHTFRTAADLVDAGADPDLLYQQTELVDTPQRLLLMQRALASLRLELDGTVAIMSLTLKDFSDTGASRDDYGGIVDIPKTVGSVKVSALALESDDGRTKLSLRSKSGTGSIDVNLVAQHFGGGGHKHAAGARTQLPLDQTIDKLVDAFRNAERLA